MTVDVTTVNDAPTLARGLDDQSATVETAFRYQVPADAFSDVENDTLGYAAAKGDDSALPSWLDFDSVRRTFSGTPQAGDEGTVPVKVTASDGNGRAVDDTFDIVVSINTDAEAPRVTGIEISPVPPEASADHKSPYTKEALLALPGGAVHGRGAVLTFTLTFDKDVTVTGDSATQALPELVLDIFGRERRARYTGGSGTSKLTFTWKVETGDNDPDGLSVRHIALNGATIRDDQGRDMEGTLPTRHFKAHRVRGGFHAMRLDVSGPAREGAPFTITVRRDGGYEESAGVLIRVTDSGMQSDKKPEDMAADQPEEADRVRLVGLYFVAEGTELNGKTVSPRFASYTMTVPGDGMADAARTLTFEILTTSIGDGEVSYWYGTGSPATMIVPVVDTGTGTDGPGLSVGPADASEEAGAVLVFEVSLNRAAGSEVTVDYTTADGTATADMDYRTTSGTLTFAPGQTVKTVEVPVLADKHDEGTETVWLVLSNPRGSVILRGRNYGHIHNSGPIPKAWLGRFGRTVAEQMLDAVEGRMRAVPQPGAEISLAGERLGASPPDRGSEAGTGRGPGQGGHGTEEERDPRREEESRRDALRLADWLKGKTDPEEAQQRMWRAVMPRDLLTGSSFALTAETPARDLVSLWGRGAVTRFDGREGGLTLDGEVVTGMLGADWTRGRWTAGLIASHGVGEGGYSGAPTVGGGTGDGSASGTGGRVEATLTGLFPWARHALSERLEAWGAAGYGAGELTVTPKKPGTNEDGAAIHADLDLWMAAAGLRGVLLDPGSGSGFQLTGKTNAMVVQTSSGRGKGADGGNMEPARAPVTRLRLGLEASRPFALGPGSGFGAGGGAVLTPSLEVGVRHDGGDAETGFGLDLGGGLALSDPKRGLTAELSGRGLLSHRSKGFRDLGFSGSLAWEGKPGSDRDAKLRLTQTIGGSSSGGADSLLARGTLEGLAANDNGAGGNDELKSRRLELKFGYGLPAFGDRFTWTPEIGVGLSDTGRDYSLGWRLVRGGSGGDGGSFELSFEARRRESANDDTPPEHEVGPRLTARF